MATASGPVEVDAVFIKALKLLHSRHPDSLEQLRALRDDVIRQHNQQVPTTKTVKVRVKIILTFEVTVSLSYLRLNKLNVKSLLISLLATRQQL